MYTVEQHFISVCDDKIRTYLLTKMDPQNAVIYCMDLNDAIHKGFDYDDLTVTDIKNIIVKGAQAGRGLIKTNYSWIWDVDTKTEIIRKDVESSYKSCKVNRRLKCVSFYINSYKIDILKENIESNNIEFIINCIQIKIQEQRFASFNRKDYFIRNPTEGFIPR